MENAFGVPRQPAHGPLFLDNGHVLFRMWAPSVKDLKLEINGQSHAMQRDAQGWYSYESDTAKPGDLYYYIADGEKKPDYVSRFQPQGVDGPSQLVRLDRAGRPRPVGRKFEETINYEMHVGTFTPEGTFAAVKDRLQDLVEQGITNIQVMPVAEFPGERGWGYEGVQLFAPHAAYGTPAELADLIDAAHRAGLTITLDVVYNHFGPRGNNIPTFADQFFDKEIETPWRAGIAFDEAGNWPVRNFYVDNAHYWLNEMGFDGLRFDATHEIHSRDFLRRLAHNIRQSMPPDRHVSLIAENEFHTAELFERDKAGNVLYFDAELYDDYHHGARVMGTGETDGYYAKYAAAPVEHIGRSLTENFGDEGKALNIPPYARLISTQTHDQNGNTPAGKRAVYDDPRHQFIAQAIMMLSPPVPMIFQGEEWHTTTPFPYICDHKGKLAEMVRKGRLKEFGTKFKNFTADEMLDPNAEETFEAAKLDWNERRLPFHAGRLADFAAWANTRKTEIVPLLLANKGWQDASYEVVEKDLVQCTWRFASGQILQTTANFSDKPLAAAQPLAGRQIAGDELPRDRKTLQPATFHICLQDGPV